MYISLETIRDRIKQPKPEVLAGFALWGLMFLVYLRTLVPGVYGFDSAELATGVFTQGIIHPPGYPFYLLVGKLFSLIPIRDIAYRLNVMSAFFGALTVLLLFYIGILLTNQWGIAWLSAAIFGFSVYFWQMSIVAEVYTLHTALLAGNLAIVLYWERTGKQHALLLFAFLYGLSLTNHTSSILFAPGFFWIIVRSKWWDWKQRGRQFILFMLFLLGLSTYLYLPLRAQSNPLLNYVSTYYNVDLSSWAGLIWMMSGQAYRFFSFSYTLQELPLEIIRFGSFLFRNFMGVGVLIGLIGLINGFRKNLTFFVGIFMSFLATVVFYINYRVMDKDTMFLAAYLFWAIFLVEGFQFIENWFLMRISFNTSNKFRPIVVLLLFLIFLPTPLLNWKWVDMHDADSYSRYAHAILSTTEPNAMVIAPWSQAVVLEYFQIVDGQRPDIKIVNSSRMNVAIYYELWSKGFKREEIFRGIAENNIALIDEYIGIRPVYSLEFDTTLSVQYEYLPDGIFFRLTSKN